MNYDLVLHVDTVDSAIQTAFSNAVNYAGALKNETFTMVLVVNSKAVTLLVADNTAIKDALERAVAAGLSIRVCNNALNANGVRPESLYPQCVVVPAGIVELVTLQRAGYAYVKA